MPPELVPDDSDYASEEDSDFAPDAAAANDASESEDEEAVEVVKAKPSSKRKRGDEEAEDAGIENSGDEAIIERGLKKKRKKGKKGDEDERGEGGLVKTRSMRAAEKTEKKTAVVDVSQATIDVDSVWADMISGKIPTTPTPTPTTEATAVLSPQSPGTERKNAEAAAQTRGKARSPSTFEEGPDAMIMIKRTYTFAGKVHTEQKLVPRSSAEAKLFLSTHPPPSPSSSTTITNPPKSSSPLAPKRRLKLARRSIFEPATESLPPRTDLHFGLKAATGEGIVRRVDGGRKLNTVEKSAVDWAGFVDKEGIADELDQAGKSKRAYKARQEFLARVEGKKIEDERRARGLPV